MATSRTQSTDKYNMKDGNQKEQPGQDGGRPGWIAVLSTFVTYVLLAAFTKGLGVMLPTLQQQFGTTTALIGWLIALVGTSAGVISPFAGLIGRRFGIGASITVSGIMVGAAAIAGSFSSNVYLLALLLMLFAGTGLGVAEVISKAAIGQRFEKNYALAVGVGKTGTSVGMLLIAPLIQLFLGTYGWRGTMMLIGGISFHLAVCGVFMFTTDKKTTQMIDYQMVRQDEHQSERETNDRCSTLKYVIDNLDLKIFRSSRYWAAAVIFSIDLASFDMWVIFYVSMAESKGFSPEDAAIFVTIAGVGNLLSKLVQAFLVDSVISYGKLMLLSTCGSVACYFVTPWMSTYWMMASVSFLHLFCVGIFTCLQDLLGKDLLGVDMLAGFYGWLGIKAALIKFSFNFLPGLMYDISGSYDGAFIFIGILQSITLIPLFILIFYKII